MCVCLACPTRISHFLQKKTTILVPITLTRILKHAYLEAYVSNALRITIVVICTLDKTQDHIILLLFQIVHQEEEVLLQTK
jgi:hypothetical protein